jgi:hypothetical protein
VYVANNPVSSLDPDGLRGESALVGAEVGAFVGLNAYLLTTSLSDASFRGGVGAFLGGAVAGAGAGTLDPRLAAAAGGLGAAIEDWVSGGEQSMESLVSGAVLNSIGVGAARRLLHPSTSQAVRELVEPGLKDGLLSGGLAGLLWGYARNKALDLIAGSEGCPD